MIVNIILEDKKKNYDEMYEKIGEPIHESLAGNQDYIDSNIVLNLDNVPVKGYEDKKYTKCTIYFSGDDCVNKEYIREKAKEVIDRFVDNL